VPVPCLTAAAQLTWQAGAVARVRCEYASGISVCARLLFAVLVRWSPDLGWFVGEKQQSRFCSCCFNRGVR
jgi:hypothetical protein